MRTVRGRFRHVVPESDSTQRGRGQLKPERDWSSQDLTRADPGQAVALVPGDGCHLRGDGVPHHNHHALFEHYDLLQDGD